MSPSALFRIARSEPSATTLAKLGHLVSNAAISILDLDPIAEHALYTRKRFQGALTVLQLDRGRNGDVPALSVRVWVSMLAINNTSSSVRSSDGVISTLPLWYRTTERKSPNAMAAYAYNPLLTDPQALRTFSPLHLNHGHHSWVLHEARARRSGSARVVRVTGQARRLGGILTVGHVSGE